MIKLINANIMDILPTNLKNAEVESIGYALMQSQKRIIDTLKKSMVYAGIDDLPESILDVLAQQLRSPYYDPDMSLDKKRTVVKNTLNLFSKLGTPEAVEEMIFYVFGKGELHEWFDTGGNPGTFSISIPETITSESLELFKKLIDKVKNTSSHLDHIDFGATIESNINAAMSMPVAVIKMTVR